MTSAAPYAMRSVLFAPANHPRRAEKAFEVGADAVILDLEDAVPPAQKSAARDALVPRLSAQRSCRAYVRVNAVGTSYWEADVEAAVGPWLDGIVVPKAEGAADMQAIDARIRECERRAGMEAGSLDLMPIIESALGIVNVHEIAKASERVRRLAFGGADYTLDLGLEWSAEEGELAYARAQLTHASRAAGIEQPVDTVIVEIKDLERVRASARNGRRMGFQGKLCIHPEQIAPCNEVYSPSAPEIARARQIIAAFEQAEAAGSGAIQLDGALIDYPIVRKARLVLELAERYAGATP